MVEVFEESPSFSGIWNVATGKAPDVVGNMSSYPSGPEPECPSMTIEPLRRAHRAAPFQPFTVRMADGRQFHIPQPDFLSMSPSGRAAVVFHDDGSASILGLLLMTKLELSPPLRATA
jgi:hypothetical protein